MNPTHFSLVILMLLHSSLALISSPPLLDQQRQEERWWTEKERWSALLAASDHRRAPGRDLVNDAPTTKIDESATVSADVSVTDLNGTIRARPVLRKCCNVGEELTVDGCVKRESNVPPFRPVVYYNVTHHIDAPVEQLFTLVFGDACMHGRYRLDPSTETDDEFYLLENGSLLLPAISTVFEGEQDFCMEGFFTDEESRNEENSIVLPLVCFPPPTSQEPDDDFRWVLYPAGLLISVPFLAFILMAHILIPKLHSTLNGKCLISHVSFLIVAYVGLATIQLSRRLIPNELCRAIAFIVQFSFIACFSWLTAMCISIWRIVSNVSTSFYNTENSHGSIIASPFLRYSIIALAIPVIIILVSLVMDLTPSIPSTFLKPQFGVGSCWFLTDVAALPYFYGPITLLIMGNIVLFVLTARKIIQKNREEANRMRSMEKNRMQIIRYENKALKVCFSLFILMGVNWMMEIISWAAGNQGSLALKTFWYITDMCNSLQGFFIFIIFIMDSEFRLLIKQKLSTWRHCKLYTKEVDEVDSKKLKQEFSMTSLFT